MLAARTRELIALTPTSTAAERPRNSLREIMIGSSLSLTGCIACRGGAGCRALRRSAAPDEHNAEQLAAAQPEVAKGLDGRDIRREPLPRFGQEREHVDLHRVVAKHRFVRDDLAQRQHFARIKSRKIVARAINTKRVARLRTRIDSPLGQPIDGLQIFLFHLADAYLAEIEQRYLELQIGSGGPANRRRLALASSPECRSCVENVDEPRRLSQPVRPGKGRDLDAPDLQVDATADRFLFDGARCPRARRKGRQRRSEEHTSELQSRVDLVCRLLLDKKKNNILYLKLDKKKKKNKK